MQWWLAWSETLSWLSLKLQIEVTGIVSRAYLATVGRRCPRRPLRPARACSHHRNSPLRARSPQESSREFSSAFRSPSPPYRAATTICPSPVIAGVSWRDSSASSLSGTPYCRGGPPVNTSQASDVTPCSNRPVIPSGINLGASATVGGLCGGVECLVRWAASIRPCGSR